MQYDTRGHCPDDREVWMEINGKKVIVIGGASGMGRASAELLHARGASVALFR